MSEPDMAKLFRDSHCNRCGWDLECITCGICCNCGYSENDCCEKPNEEADKIFKSVNRSIGR